MTILSNMILLGATGGGNYMTFLFLGGTMLIFYFFFIRPQSQKAKQQRKFLEDLKKGDKVVTAGGIHGKILKVDETTMLVEVDSNVKMRFDKSVISAEMTKAAQEGKE